MPVGVELASETEVDARGMPEETEQKDKEMGWKDIRPKYSST